MKKMLIVLVIISTLIAGTSVAYAGNNFLMVNNYKVKGIYFALTEDEKGDITGQTLMVPLRDVAENALGHKITWNPETMTATVTTTKHETIKKVGDIQIKKSIYLPTTIKFTKDSGIISISNDSSQAEYIIPGNGKVVENGDMLYIPEKAIIDVFGLEQRPVDK